MCKSLSGPNVGKDWDGIYQLVFPLILTGKGVSVGESVGLQIVFFGRSSSMGAAGCTDVGWLVQIVKEVTNLE